MFTFQSVLSHITQDFVLVIVFITPGRCTAVMWIFLVPHLAWGQEIGLSRGLVVGVVLSFLSHSSVTVP